ncbi:hypothetical protein KR009_000451, partial [Drosophila setifemur]
WPLAGSLLLVLLLVLLPSGIRSQCMETTQPGCLQQVEMGFPQRHCLDPTKYWLCAALGQKAELKRCQANTGFDQDINACVPWFTWVWQPCVEPPSRPPGWQPC